MEVLTAFVRKNSLITSEIRELENPEEKIKALEKLEPVNIQLQAALTVIKRRNPDQDKTEEEEELIKYIDLRNSNLRSANLIRANLSSADLFDVNLFGANLIRANLRIADLFGANLRDAELSSARNLSNEQIKSACFWEEAIFIEEEQANRERIEEIRQDKASDPKNTPDCWIWKR